MRGHVLLVLFVCVMPLFTTFLYAIQESDDKSYESTTTALLRQRRQKCPLIRGSLNNGRVKMRNRGRIAKFTCNRGYELIGNRINTCIQGQWSYPIPVCAAKSQNTTKNCESESKSTTNTTPMTTLSTSPLININAMSKESTTSFADYSKTSQSIPITTDIENSNAFTSLTTVSEVLSLTSTTSPYFDALRNSVSSAAPDSETESTALLDERYDSIKVRQDMPFNESTGMSSTSHSTEPSTQSTNISFATETESTQTSNLNPFSTSDINTSSITEGITVRSSQSTDQSIESKTRVTTAVNPITSDSSIGNHRQSISALNQTIQTVSITSTISLTTGSSAVPTTPIPTSMRTTSSSSIHSSSPTTIITTIPTTYRITTQTTGLTSRSTTSPTPRRMASPISRRTASPTSTHTVSPSIEIRTSVKSNPNDKNIFDTNTIRQTTIQRQNLIPEPTLSLTVPMNDSMFGENSTGMTTITPVIRTTTSLRRRRPMAAKTRVTINSVVSDLKDNKFKTSSVLSISVTIVSMTLIIVTLSLYFIRKLRNSQQNRLSDDSEMRFLTLNQS